MTTLEASSYGTATRPRRRFLMAVRSGALSVPASPREPMPTTSFGAALGWPAGEEVNTRGVCGVDPATGRPKGASRSHRCRHSDALGASRSRE